MRELLRPIVVAPMAGGPSTPGLVIAAGHAGALGFLAAGYKPPEAVEAEVQEVRKADVPYGVNLFVPSSPPADVAPLERYRAALQPEADRYGIDLPPLRLSDDDHFAAKVDLAVSHRIPLVSFTFGIPPAAVVTALRSAGCAVLITVTSGAEARQAVAAGPDALIAQGGSAGGHASTFSPATYTGTRATRDVLAEVLAVARTAADIPVIAAGGGDVAALLAAGAAAVQCGTAFVLSDEAGTRPAQRAAMLSGDHRETVVTRAFTGQPARALRNRFVDTYSSIAPIGYPAIHHLTAPIRAAAARRGDASALNLWAGVNHASARPAPVAAVIDALRG
ncbi:2-nitropropane dioxygenase [Actinoplanes sp. SE50]|uniref:NAD(P)H-dependent flavin oxidoreductase n=1 Tax=unclassified Actinoplanes TaxID=2626549 RepID=UPI00023EC075|nr:MULTISPECIES: nitronate monooxygenase [unclassified Actinoplanes]AEV82967.1 2-nitropropane dioxygenase, NPD [Actinoplanes sp. SE50/110]ATO81363.1 2-nitropropane dioxygenase [Actinoplanes sp. SE50]SLL98770.1 2-nitropropane dioxygenase [Actinoplanes sp. SE50/110]